MKFLKLFSTYSFKWQARSFLVINFLAILMLISLGRMPYLVPSLGLMLIYVLFVYALASASTTMGSLGTNQNQYGSSFSGKYLMSLPISKKELLANLLISNSYSLIPTLVALTWIFIFWEQGKYIEDRTTKFIIEYLSTHKFITIISVASLYISFLALSIRNGIESPRKVYNKGTLGNYLLFFKGAIIYCFYSTLLSSVLMASVYFEVSWPMPVILFCIGIFEIIKTYKVMINESLSYWNKTRDLKSIGIYIVSTGFLLSLIFLLIDSQNRYSKKHWEYYFSNGDEIFKNVITNKEESIQRYIDENRPLNLVNGEGVGLIHAFSTLDFSKFKGIDEYFLKNSELLLTQVHTKDKKCKTIFYCEGVTPFHILAVKGNAKTLQKALALHPEAVSILNSDMESPLHYSSRHCTYENAKVLIDFKSDINRLSSEQYSPLMESTARGCLTSSILLLKAGANVELKNKDNKTAADIAKKKKYNEILFLIEGVFRK